MLLQCHNIQRESLSSLLPRMYIIDQILLESHDLIVLVSIWDVHAYTHIYRHTKQNKQSTRKWEDAKSGRKDLSFAEIPNAYWTIFEVFLFRWLIQQKEHQIPKTKSRVARKPQKNSVVYCRIFLIVRELTQTGMNTPKTSRSSILDSFQQTFNTPPPPLPHQQKKPLQ